jgi:cell division protein FtsN
MDDKQNKDEAKKDEHEELALPPLSELTALVLDAADAANDSAHTTAEALVKLDQFIRMGKETTSSIKRAPAIFAAVMLAMGVMVTVVLAVVLTKIQERTEILAATTAQETLQLKKLSEAYNKMNEVNNTLLKFDGVAAEVTDRAVNTLREQTKRDREALQDLEVRRINEAAEKFKSALAEGSGKVKPMVPEDRQRLAEIQTRLDHIESQLAELPKANAAAASHASQPAKPAKVSLPDDQLLVIKTLATDMAAMRKDINALNAMEAKRAREPVAGVPKYHQDGSN